MAKAFPQKNRANFYEDVWEVVKLIPHGRVTSYGAIARYLGAAKSARMVGYALNDSSTIARIPAHRVVNRLGQLSGRHHFPPDRPMDEALKAEGVPIEDFQIQNFQQYFWDPNLELL